MSRKLATLSALIVGGTLWLLIAWPSSQGEPEPPLPAEPPLAPAAPQPAAAAEPAARKPAPVAATPEPVAPEPVAEPVRPRALPDRIQGDQGPVEEYRRTYDSETRNADSTPTETHIRDSFLKAAGTTDLFQSVSCRETICKVEMRWSPDRMRNYVAALTWIGVGGQGPGVPDPERPRFTIPLALSPTGERDADGVGTVELYLKRQPPSAASPAHAH